jgi:MoaA/NifB/PqqE/SkfB family radical SAM enzyme
MALGAVRSLGDENFLSSLQIATSVSHRIIDKLPDIYESIRKERINEWRLITVFPGGRAKNNGDVLLRNNDYRKLYSFVRDVRKSKPSINVTVDEEGYLGVEFEREVRDAFYNCPAGIEVGEFLRMETLLLVRAYRENWFRGIFEGDPSATLGKISSSPFERGNG